MLQGDFNSEWVSVYITLPGVGQAKDRVSCTFGQRAFDLQVTATKIASVITVCSLKLQYQAC